MKFIIFIFFMIFISLDCFAQESINESNKKNIHTMTRDMNSIKLIDKNGTLFPVFTDDKLIFKETKAFKIAKKFSLDHPFHWHHDLFYSESYSSSNLLRVKSLNTYSSGITTYFDRFANYYFIPHIVNPDLGLYLKKDENKINPNLTDFNKTYIYSDNKIQKVIEEFTIDQTFPDKLQFPNHCKLKSTINNENNWKNNLKSIETNRDIVSKQSKYTLTYEYYPDGQLKSFKSILNYLKFVELIVKNYVYSTNSGWDNYLCEREYFHYTFYFDKPIGTQLDYNENGDLKEAKDFEIIFDDNLFQAFYAANKIEIEREPYSKYKLLFIYKVNGVIVEFTYDEVKANKVPTDAEFIERIELGKNFIPFIYNTSVYFNKNKEGSYYLFHEDNKCIIIDANSHKVLEKIDDLKHHDSRLEKYYNSYDSNDGTNIFDFVPYQKDKIASLETNYDETNYNNPFELDEDFYKFHPVDIKDVNGLIRPVLTKQHKFLKYNDEFKNKMKHFIYDSIYLDAHGYQPDKIKYELTFNKPDIGTLYYGKYKILEFEKFYDVEKDNSIRLTEIYKIVQDSIKKLDPYLKTEKTHYIESHYILNFSYFPNGQLQEYSILNGGSLIESAKYNKLGILLKKENRDYPFRTTLKEVYQKVYSKRDELKVIDLGFSYQRKKRKYGKFWKVNLVINDSDYNLKNITNRLTNLIIDDNTGKIIIEIYKNEANSEKTYKNIDISKDLMYEILKIYFKKN